MQVIYEDNHVIAVNKAPGEIVQGDKTGDKPLSELVKDYIKVKYAKPGNVFLGVAHRLDRPVSGVVVFARTSKALPRLNLMFSRGEVEKTYLAIVANRPQQDEGEIESWLTRNERLNKSFVSKEGAPGARLARLRYKLVATTGRYHLLAVRLLTGRHHQIRCQLASIGCPIRGDLKYGARRSNPDSSISLHSWRARFEHPVSHIAIDLTAPCPNTTLWETLTSDLDNNLTL
jgi:23S rRNA pseudouridine1911/1915/1917 synthase